MIFRLGGKVCIAKIGKGIMFPQSQYVNSKPVHDLGGSKYQINNNESKNWGKKHTFFETQSIFLNIDVGALERM